MIKSTEISKYLTGENFGAQKFEISLLAESDRNQYFYRENRTGNENPRNRIQIAFNFCVLWIEGFSYKERNNQNQFNFLLKKQSFDWNKTI